MRYSAQAPGARRDERHDAGMAQAPAGYRRPIDPPQHPDLGPVASRAAQGAQAFAGSGPRRAPLWSSQAAPSERDERAEAAQAGPPRSASPATRQAAKSDLERLAAALQRAPSASTQAQASRKQVLHETLSDYARLPEIETEMAYRAGDVAPPRQFGRAVNFAAGALSLAFVAGLCIWGYGQVKRDVSGVPVVRALDGPMREAPEDPGGVVADHAGLAVNAVQAEGVAEAPAQTLTLAPTPPDLASEDLPQSALRSSGEAPAAEPAPAPATALPAPGAAPVDEEADDPIARALAMAEALGENAQPLSGAAQAAPESAETVPGSDAVTPDDEGATAGVAEDVVEPAAPAAGTAPGLSRSLRPAPRPRTRAVVPSETPLATSASAAAIAAAVAEATEVRSDTMIVAGDGVRELSDVAPGTRLVQLGAFDSPEEAREAWTFAEGLVDGLMDGKARLIQEAEAGGRTFYRLRVEGFADLSDARRFCTAVDGAVKDCIPVIAR